MGTIKKGVLGGFSGTVGTVIGGSWKGREYMRSQPGPRKKAPSAKQLAVEAKFSTVARFLSSFGSLMKFSFKTELTKLSSRNTAHRTIYQSALAGTYPDFVIDCTKVQISNGMAANVIIR